MQPQKLSASPATKGGKHFQDGPTKVAVGCLVDVIRTQRGLPSVHTRHDGTQRAQQVAS